MSFSPEDDISEQTSVPTPRIKLDDEFIGSQQEKMDVYLRIRPLLPAEILHDSKPCICVEDSHVVRTVAPLESAKFKSSAHDNSGLEQIFRFTRTFGPEVDQVQFFEETMKTTLENFIRGQNELVFAYGSTGSGKTYTMQGGLAQPGVIPLTIHLLFCSIKGKQVMSPKFKPHKYSDVIKLSKSELAVEEVAREKLLSHIDSEDFDDSRSLSGKSSMSISTIFSDDSLNASSQSNLTNKELSILESTLRMKNTACESVTMQGEVLFSIWVSFVEIYNENIYDLLEPVTSNKRSRLLLKEDENRNIYVRGLKEIRVTSSEEALKLFCLGKRNLRIASTKLNYKSSRSHCIFSIKVIRVLGIDSPLSARVNRLSYCDLAGSERSAKTQNTGIRLKEAGNINTSLMVLGRCIEALRQQGPKDKKMVPYRDSKLTRLFSAFFTGKGKASMIINVSPSSLIFDETLNVLKFSALAKQVISNDLSIKPLSQWNQEISRLTEAWEKSSTRWSSFCRSSASQRESIDVIAETSMEDENDIDNSSEEIIQRDQIIEELLGHVKTMSDELRRVLIEKQNLEAEIRAQVCREFAENFVRIDNCYREQLKDLEESGLALNREVHKKGKNDMSKDADEEENAGDSDEDTEEDKEYASAHEDTPPPVLSKAIEDSETEFPEDQDHQYFQKSDSKSGKSNIIDGKSKSSPRKTKERRQNSTLKDSELKKYETLLSSKDAEILDLQKRIGKQSEAAVKNLQELQNTVNSKDADLAALRAKVKEAELTFDKEFAEYEKILSSKGEEVIRIKDKIKEKDAIISSHESKMKELEDVIRKRDDEVARLRGKFESEVSSKDQELEKCSKSLNSRVQEVTELKGKIEEMEKVIVANEKKLADYISVMSLKDVEISLLSGNDVGRKANGIKQYETALRCKDEEIIELKKKVEAEHFDLLEKERELEGFKNSMNLKDNELAQLKKKLEENGIVAPKEEELRECEVKDAEICELKKVVEKLLEDVASREKEIEDYKNIVSLKTTEVHLLKEKIEESEVIISKPNEYSDSEAIVKSKDESIARLKKEVEGHRKAIFFKDKELEECRNILNSREKELALLKDKIEEHEVIIPKSTEIKEYKKSLNSKEAEIMRLKKKIDELQGSVISKDELLQELESTIQKGGDILIAKDSEINELQRQISDLKNKSRKSRDGKTKDDNNIIKSQEMEIASLSGKIDKLHKKILLKDSKIEEHRNIIKSQEEEITNLQGKIGELDKVVSTQDSKIEEHCNIIKSQEEEIKNLQEKIGALDKVSTQDGCIQICEKGSVKAEGLLCSGDKESVALQQGALEQRIAEVSEALKLHNKTPEWQNVHYLVELVQESFKTFSNQNSEIATMKKTYNDLMEKFEGSKKLIEDEFNKKFEEQEDSLSKKNAEIKELESKLAEEKLIQQELNKKLGEQEDSLSSKNAEIKELENKLVEEEKSMEKHAFVENQMKTFRELILVLQKVELQAYSKASGLEQKLLNFKDELDKKDREVQKLACKVQEEEEKGRQVAEEANIRLKAQEEKERQRAEEEKERQKAEEEKERQRAEEEEKRRRAEEERERHRAEEERERLEAEEKKKSMRVEKKIQTENCEIEKHEIEVQTENLQNQTESRLSECHQNFGTAELSKSNLKLRKSYLGVKDSKETEASEVLEEDTSEMSDTDGARNYRKSTVSLEELQKRVSFAECLVHTLQRLECLATDTIVRLHNVNKSYCKKFLDMSENFDILKAKLAAAEQEIIEKENLFKEAISEEDSNFKPREVSVGSSQESAYLLETLQKIEQASTQKINHLSDDNLRLVCENNALVEKVQASKVELELVNQEIERRDQEYCKIQGYLRKRDARILCLEYELSDAHRKIKNVESKNRMQLLEERTQHGIEVEGVMALKRQAETDYKSLERKLVSTTESKEEPRQRKKQIRSTRYKGRKRTSADEDKDFEPTQKRRMVKSQVYVECDSISSSPLEAENLHSTETPSSLQRLQDYVAGKSPVIQAVARRVKTFLSPKSGNTEDCDTSTLKKKRKLFNNSCAPSFISSPVEEPVKKISPKTTVKRRFRSKKDSK